MSHRVGDQRIAGGSGDYLLAGGALLWVQTAAMTERPFLQAAPFVGQVAMTTHVGQADLVAALAAVTLLAASFLRVTSRRRTVLFGISGACFIVIAATRSWSSHAGASGHLLPAIVDWLHLHAVTAWAGPVLLSAFLVLRGSAPSAGDERIECASAIQSLSTIATCALLVVLATGTFSAWRALDGSPSLLLTSSYGRLLLVKIGVVAIAASLGARNRLVVLTPLLAALRSPHGPPPAHAIRTFRTTLLLEAAVFVAAFGLAAALATAAPPPELP